MLKKVLWLSLPIYLLSNEFSSSLQNELDWLEEEKFVVSVSKVKENIKRTSASVSIIEDDELVKMGAKTFLDALNIVSGINISNTYVYQDKISIRGIQGNFTEKVLVLLDGHSLNADLLNGGALGAYQNFPIELIKKIEIIKGPASVLYGENAFSALINIITKKSNDIDGTVVSLKAGSNNTKRVNILHGEAFKNFYLSTNLDFLSSNGDIVFLENDASGKSGNTSPSIDTINFYLSLIHKNGVYIKGNINKIENGPNFGIMNILNDIDLSKRRSFFIESGIKKEFNPFFIHSRVYYDFYKVNNKWSVSAYPNGIGYSGNESKKVGLETLFTYKKTNYNWVSGFSFEKQKLENPWQKMNWNPITNVAHPSEIRDYSDSNTNFISEVDRNFWALYSELIYDLSSKVRVNTGLRYDSYSDFGGVANPRVGLNWLVNDNNILKFMYGEAFRAPTFAELYNKNNPSIVGNPELKPEKVKTLEVSLQNNTIKKLESSITLFNSKIDDIIVLTNNKYMNEGKAKTKGLEFELKYNLHRGSYILSNYTFQKAVNAQTNEDIVNIPNHMLSILFNHRVNKKLNLLTNAKFLGSQSREVNSSREKVDKRIIVDLTLLGRRIFTKKSDIRLSIYNLFNKKTEDSGSTIDYPVLGRTYLVEFKYKF